MLVYGVLSGFTLDVDVGTLLFNSATVRGFYLYRWTAKRGAENLKKDYEWIIKSVLSKELTLSHEDFNAKTKHADAIKHAQQPGKADKTILLF